MTAARFYSSVAGEMVLQADITAASSTLTVDTTTGLPGTTPFTVVIDPGLATEEILNVSNVSSTTLTVSRGVDGSSAQSHTAGAKLRHMATARDFREPQEHIGASAAVHGITGSVVGTTDTQALTNKDMSSATNTFPSSLATDAELAAHTGATAAHGATGAVVGTTNSQSLTNKDLSSGTNVFPSTLATDAELSAHTGATAAHGATGAVVGTTNTQTLTNKTIDGGSNTLTNIPAASVTGLTSLTADVNALNAVTSQTTGITAATGWTVEAINILKVGRICQIYIRGTRTGATITGNSTGDITNSTVATIDSSTFWPAVPSSGSANASGQEGSFIAWTDGGIALVSLGPSTNFASGAAYSAAFTFITN